MKKPTLAAAMSALVWGSGQIYNKQLAKGLAFFAIQMTLIAVEMLGGNYFSGAFEFREAGFFVSGIWGMITLGTQLSELTYQGMTPGDHSVMLLLQGIIAVIILLLVAAIWFGNVKDAYQTAKNFNETGMVLSSKKWLKDTWEKSFEYIMMVPAGLMLVFFVAMPIIFAVVIAFTNHNLHNMPPANLIEWVGLRNFRFLFSIGDIPGGDMWLHTFTNIFIWTIIFAVVSTIVPFFLGLFQAVILNNKRIKFKKLWRSILILPWAMPAIISQLNFRQIFNGRFGPFNRFFMNIGLMDPYSPIEWLSDPRNPWLPRGTILVIGFWLGFPYWMALMSGLMTSISKDVYEAAEIDGASEGQQFWKITLPMVIAMAAPLLVMSFAFNFNNFGLIYFLTEGGPINVNFIHAGQTDILISWIFSLTMDEMMYNLASAMSIIIFIIIGSLSAWNFARTKAFKEEL
ncbi:MAG: sugar ABC transporter permease [Turicibacter sp.]|nr:sugar ABC transporter permease [Turicibacter sp.]